MLVDGAARLPFSPGDDIASKIRQHAALRPNRIALRSGARVVTYAELANRIDALSAALASGGVGPNRRVAILAGNSIAYVELFFGALAAGASVVPLPTLASVDALTLMLDDSTPALVATDSAHREAMEATLARSAHRAATHVATIGLDFEDGDWTTVDRMEAPDGKCAPSAITGDDEFDVMYSSGTTGVPKGIVHSHAVRKASYAGGRLQYFSSDSLNIVSTPFYSNTTCVTWLLTTAAGGENILLGKFDAAEFLRVVSEQRATHAMLVPVQHERILLCESLAESDVSSLRFLFSTSAPLRAETKRAILDRFDAELIEIYGTTEGGVVTSLPARQFPHKLATVGRPGADCELKILDDGGRELEQGRAGEVVGRAPNMMCGYLNRPDATEEALWRAPDGRVFIRSGDIGRLDEDGFLHLLDRVKDVIISGGFNVYATDLEAVLLRHPEVSEAAVIGIPSDTWGETPLALVVPKHGRRPAESDILNYCNGLVGKNQRLSGVELRTDLPKNAIGKILKKDLRRPYWTPER